MSPMKLPALLRASLALSAAACIAGAAALLTTRSEPAHAAGTRTLLGVMDDALLAGDPGDAWAAIQQLHPQVLRFDVSWPAIATHKPASPRNPDDPAYQWATVDGVVAQATAMHIPVVLSITDTPAWAGGGATHRRAPRSMLDLQSFAFAAATRYD